MRIEQISIANYRQYEEVEIEFPPGDAADLHLLIGENGTGKTNLVNAITWCLYGDEPHLSRASSAVARPNTGVVDAASDGDRVSVRVELVVDTGRESPLTFRREETYRISCGEEGQPNLNVPVLEGTEFVVIRREEGDAEFLDGEEAEAQVERFVPKGIRDFFLFDSERLDQYFREATAQSIRHAIFELSRIDLLERVSKHLDTICTEFRRKTRKESPQLEEAERELEEAEKRRKEAVSRVGTCRGEITTARQKFEECRKELEGIEHASELERRRGEVEATIGRKRQAREEKAQQKAGLLLEHGVLAGFLPSVERLVRSIRDKRDSHEIPPAIAVSALEESLAQAICELCGQPLSVEAQNRVRSLQEQMEISAEVSLALLSMEGYLSQVSERAAGFEDDMRRAAEDLRDLDTDLTELQSELAEIDRKLVGMDTARVRELVRQRGKFDNMHNDAQQRLGQFQVQQRLADERLEKAKEAYESELKRTKKVGTLRDQIAFCQRAVGAVDEAKQGLMASTRSDIQAGTTRIFRDLTWKQHTFERVWIDEDYSLGIVDPEGRERLGDLSAAERQLLALSFTLSLHEVSGFSSPILVDTPVARVTGDNRKRFAQVLGRLSEGKQVVLILTPDEYSPDVRECLAPMAATVRRLALDEHERSTRLVSMRDGN